MVAKSKSELIAISDKEFAKLTKLIETIDPKTAMKKREEDTSIKDVVAHRAHWIDMFLGWYLDGLAGQTVYFPAKGYKWNDLKRHNADLRHQQSDIGWPEAVAMLEANYAKFREFLEARSEADLYGGPMAGANNAWTPGRWAEAAGPSHFRSAAKYLRAVLRNRN